MILANKMTLVSLILSTSVMAFGQNNTSATTLVAEKPEKALSVAVGFSYSTNMFKEGEFEKSTSLNLEVIPAYKLTETVSLSSVMQAARELTHQQDMTFGNTVLRVGHKTAQINENLTWSNRAELIAPTDRTAYKTDRFQGGAGLRTALSYKNTNPYLPYTLTGFFRVRRLVHEYTANADGAANVQSQLSQGFLFEGELTEKLGMSLAGNYHIATTYSDSKKYSFEAAADLGYSLTDNLGVSVGVSNLGNALKANGVDSNIALINDQTSEISFGVDYTY